VTFQNRVTPAGDLVAVDARGTLTGNRGILHDDHGRIVRRSQVRRWIICRLEFHGWHRAVMTPRRYTHLFFLDEATALAAGHRPCATCRRDDCERFRRLWAGTAGLPHPPSAQTMDDVLHAERALVGGRRQTRLVEADRLPDGAMVRLDDDVWLVASGALARWTFAGYVERRPLPQGELPALTPPSTLAVLRAGYRPALHPTAPSD
jgi:hypothetical protein